MKVKSDRIENEVVVRCKERRKWMKSTVSARHASAVANSAYIIELKNTGAALTEFGQGESYDPNLPSSYSYSAGVESSASVAPTSDADLLPPPRPSEFSAASLQRFISMPNLLNKLPSKIKTTRGEEEVEADDEEEEDEEKEHGTRLKRRHQATRAIVELPSSSPPTPFLPPRPPHSTPPSFPNYWLSMDHSMMALSLDLLNEIQSERADAPDEKINTPVVPPPTANHHDDKHVTPKKVVIEPPMLAK